MYHLSIKEIKLLKKVENTYLSDVLFFSYMVVQNSRFAPVSSVISREEQLGRYLRSGAKMLKLVKTFSSNNLSQTLWPFH